MYKCVCMEREREQFYSRIVQDIYVRAGKILHDLLVLHSVRNGKDMIKYQIESKNRCLSYIVHVCHFSWQADE